MTSFSGTPAPFRVRGQGTGLERKGSAIVAVRAALAIGLRRRYPAGDHPGESGHTVGPQYLRPHLAFHGGQPRPFPLPGRQPDHLRCSLADGGFLDLRFPGLPLWEPDDSRNRRDSGGPGHGLPGQRLGLLGSHPHERADWLCFGRMYHARHGPVVGLVRLTEQGCRGGAGSHRGRSELRRRRGPGAT